MADVTQDEYRPAHRLAGQAGALDRQDFPISRVPLQFAAVRLVGRERLIDGIAQLAMPQQLPKFASLGDFQGQTQEATSRLIEKLDALCPVEDENTFFHAAENGS